MFFGVAGDAELLPPEHSHALDRAMLSVFRSCRAFHGCQRSVAGYSSVAGQFGGYWPRVCGAFNQCRMA